MDADISQILILQAPHYQPGTLKALLAENNYDLHSLEKKFGCDGIHLDAKITRRELLFVGKEAQFQELLVSYLKNFSLHKWKYHFSNIVNKIFGIRNFKTPIDSFSYIIKLETDHLFFFKSISLKSNLFIKI